MTTYLDQQVFQPFLEKVYVNVIESVPYDFINSSLMSPTLDCDSLIMR